VYSFSAICFVFRANDIVPAFLHLQANGYAITVGLDATLSISDSCFINNNFVGDGIILAQEMDDVSHSNIYGTADDELTCAFAMIAGDCVPFSSSSCTAKKGKVVVEVITDPTLTASSVSSSMTSSIPSVLPSDTSIGSSKNGISTSGTSSVKIRISIMAGILSVLAL
jgi:hypothetical protein